MGGGGGGRSGYGMGFFGEGGGATWQRFCLSGQSIGGALRARCGGVQRGQVWGREVMSPNSVQREGGRKGYESGRRGGEGEGGQVMSPKAREKRAGKAPVTWRGR